MTEEIVQRFIHRLFNSDLSKDGKAIRNEKLPYINLPLYKYCSVCESDKRTKDTIDYNIDNFENDILYFQNPAKFNDPFDCYLGFSQTQIVRDIMIQQLKQQHQYTPQNREIIQTLFEQSDDSNELLEENMDIVVSIMRDTATLLVGDDAVEKAVLDSVCSLSESDITLFKRIFSNQLTILDKQRIVDLMFDNPTFQASLSTNLQNPEFSLAATRHDMKWKMENNPSEMLYEDEGIGLTGIDLILNLATMIKGNQYSIKDIDSIKEQFDSISKESIKKARQVVSEQFRVTCLSQKMDSSLMWSHYANKHYGFCLEYDFTATVSYQPNDLLTAQLMLFPVHYSDERPLLSKALFDTKNLFNYKKNNMLPAIAFEKIMYGLLGKSSDWDYEEEWRIFQLGNKDTMKLPKARKVFLGANIEDSPKQRIMEIAKKKNIPVFQMYLKADKYKFDYYRVL